MVKRTVNFSGKGFQTYCPEVVRLLKRFGEKSWLSDLDSTDRAVYLTAVRLNLITPTAPFVLTKKGTRALKAATNRDPPPH